MSSAPRPPHPSIASHCAGVAAPLFSLRGTSDVGVGEILDLIPLVEWASACGLRVIQLLPIGETAPGEASPYNALSAFAIDPLYISVRAVPGAPPVSAIPAGSGSLPRDALRAAKLRSLESSFAAFQDEPARSRQGLGRFIDANRDWLDDYALYRALKEEHDFGAWESWPDGQRTRDAVALSHAAAKLAPRIEFFRYVQWVAASQWARVRATAASRRVWLKGDLPFVLGRDSADVWVRQHEFVPGWSVGAPPDEFSPTGQSWGLPLYDWERVRASNFAWWRRRVRQAAELYDLFRIDHIIGFFRTYAIPDDGLTVPGFVPMEESAQREQGEAFLQAVLDEAGAALTVAEDLGSVSQWVRQILHDRGVPGYKVFRWERDNGLYRDPRTYDPLSITTTGTHDTDTMVEWWATLEPLDRRAILAALTLEPAVTTKELTDELRSAILSRLYGAGSAFVIVPIQDLFGWAGQINVPATPSEGNWNWRMPMTIDELSTDPAARRASQQLKRDLVTTSRSDE